MLLTRVFFNSALPPEAWRPGDEFLAGGLRRFRIVAVVEFETRGYEQRTASGSSSRSQEQKRYPPRRAETRFADRPLA
jgi:hypothetical protein